MKHKIETLVIGGGAIGICCAHYLQEQGREVMVVEKGDICSGASHGNAGLIVPSYSMPLAAPGVISKCLGWLADPESPFYIKPSLRPTLFHWLWKFRGGVCLSCSGLRRDSNKERTRLSSSSHTASRPMCLAMPISRN